MSTQMTRQRRTWLLIPPVHTAIFMIQWLLWQLVIVEAHPIMAPVGYIVGSVLVLAILTSFAPITCAIALALIGYGPRAVTVVLIGIASGTISHTLFRSWLSLGLPNREGDNLLIIFVQNGLALVFVVGIYIMHKVRADASRAA